MLSLPDGPVIEIDFYPLHELADRARRERNAALLLFLENDACLHSLVHVDEVCVECGGTDDAIDARGEPHCATLRPTGFSVDDIFAGRAGWMPAQCRALRAYLRSAAVHARLTWLRRDLLCLRACLTDRAILRPDRRRLLPAKAAPVPRASKRHVAHLPVSAADTP